MKELSIWMDEERRKERAERAARLEVVRSQMEEHKVGGQQLSPQPLKVCHLLVKGKDICHRDTSQ